MNKKAIVYMLISASCFAIMSVMVKSIEGIGAIQLVFFRSITTALICVAILKVQNISLRGNQEKLLIIRAVVGSISLLLFFMALKIMPVGTAVSLRYLSPFFGILLAIQFLGENVRPIQFLFIAIAFTGALVVKGFDTNISLYAFVLIMGSAFLSGCVYTLIRKIGSGDYPIVIVLYFSGIASLLSGLASFFTWVEPNSGQWVLLMSLGIFGFFGQFFMTKAFQLEETNKVAPLKYTEAILAILIAWIWLGETHNWVTLLGIGMIFLGVVLNSISKKRVYL